MSYYFLSCSCSMRDCQQEFDWLLDQASQSQSCKREYFHMTDSHRKMKLMGV